MLLWKWRSPMKLSCSEVCLMVGLIGILLFVCWLLRFTIQLKSLCRNTPSTGYVHSLTSINLQNKNFPPFFFMYPGGWKHHIYQELMQSEPLLENIVTLEFNSCSTWIGIFVLIWKSAGFYILNRCKRVNSWFSTSQVRGGLICLIFFLKLTSRY